jgi:hypothetical protein
LVSPGSVVGGAFFDTSHPHCAHSFASGDIGSPQKLQYFFTLVPWAPLTATRPLMVVRSAAFIGGETLSSLVTESHGNDESVWGGQSRAGLYFAPEL